MGLILADLIQRNVRVTLKSILDIPICLAMTPENYSISATHGGTARCVLGHLLGLPQSHWGVIGGLSNAAWSILQMSPKGWHLVEHNSGSIPEPVYGEESGAEPNGEK